MDETINLLDDPSYIWQERMGGERRLVTRNGDDITLFNVEGQSVRASRQVIEALRAIPLNEYVIDGSTIGSSRFAAFDLVATPADPRGLRPFRDRLIELQLLLRQAPSTCWAHVPSVDNPEDAKLLLQAVGVRGGAGLVGKRADASYSAAGAGDIVKFEFLECASLLVVAQNPLTRTITVAAQTQSGERIPVGEVPVPTDVAMPPVDCVVEVHYLYARQNGELVQPSFAQMRPDLGAERCTLHQLKYGTGASYDDIDDTGDTPHV